MSMAKSTRRPQKIFAVVMWVLSLIFAGFLIGLGNQIIRDIPRVDQPVSIEDFIDRDQMAGLRATESELTEQTQSLQRVYEDALGAEASSQANYRASKSRFDNWIETRTATQVLSRTRELEGLSAQVRDAERAVANAQTKQREQSRSLSDIRRKMSDLRDIARPDYRKAQRIKELRVFGFRLLLTLPQSITKPRSRKLPQSLVRAVTGPL